MIDIASVQLTSMLQRFPSSGTYELRSKSFDRLRNVTRHEVELLAEKRFCVGRWNKKGLQYILLTSSTQRAMSLLRKSISQGGRAIAEDNQTTSRQVVFSCRASSPSAAGVVYSHRGDMQQAWNRSPHWSNWGALDRGARAVVVIPRQVNA